MELGGNAPFLVFDDADLDAAVEGALIAKMRNIGEACTAANRFHVAESLADEFAEKLADRMGAMKVGRGTEEDVEVGPLIDDDQRSRRWPSSSTTPWARAPRRSSAARRVDGAGYFYEPTVLPASPTTPALLKEEIFGPVAPVNVVRLRGGGDRRRQRHRVRPGRLRLHARPQARRCACARASRPAWSA